MADEANNQRKHGNQPVLVGPRPFSFDNVLSHIDPAPDEETEQFVAAIYADRRQSAKSPSRE